MKYLFNIIIWILLAMISNCKANPDKLIYFQNCWEGMEVAKIQNKPVLVYFTLLGLSDDEFMQDFASSPGIQKMLNEDFVTVILAVDHPGQIIEQNTLDLYKMVFDENEQLRQSPLRTVGQVNALLQKEYFGGFYQPMYVILNSDGKILVNPTGYLKRNRELFLEILDEGLKMHNLNQN